MLRPFTGMLKSAWRESASGLGLPFRTRAGTGFHAELGGQEPHKISSFRCALALKCMKVLPPNHVLKGCLHSFRDSSSSRRVPEEPTFKNYIFVARVPVKGPKVQLEMAPMCHRLPTRNSVLRRAHRHRRQYSSLSPQCLIVAAHYS
jgi:hypothetical protein